MLPFFTIFERTVGMYGVCAIIGLFAACAVCVWLGRRFSMEIDDIIIMLLVACGGLLIGGHLLYALVNIRILIAVFGAIGQLTFAEFFTGLGIAFGGNVFYGGMLGGALALWIYGHCSKKYSARIFLDLFAVAAPLFHVFGRIGCFLGGCCYGIESSFGFVVHGNTIVPEINDVCRFPVALLEAGCNLLIFFTVLFCFQRKKCSGRLFALYLALYAPVRFCVEFLRGDLARGIFFGLSTSQWISLAILLVLAVRGTICFVRTRKRPKEQGNVQA